MNSEIIIYQNPSGDIKIDVRLDDETVWLTQAQIAELFGKGRITITENIQNVFKEGELDENSVCRYFRQTAADVLGKKGFSIHLGMSIVHKTDEVVTLQTNLNLSSFFSNKLDKSTIFTLY